jgi:flagellin
MGLRIRTNIQSMVAQRNLKMSSERQAKHMDRVSSGFRINKAADDAAGLAISEVLRADIRSMGQARRNANDAVSLIQVAEGGLEEINSLMIRLRELSVQSASDTVGVRERGYLNKEFMALKDEIDRIALSTEFNGTLLLIGDKEVPEALLDRHNNSPLEIQVGKDYHQNADGLDTANPINVMRLNFEDFNATTTGNGSLNLGSAESGDGARIDSKEGAQNSIATIESAMGRVAAFRADLGAVQNRLESTDRNMAIGISNLSAAKSRIKDADFATETAELTQANIMQQAGASVLTQANQLPQVALKLLQ